MTDPFDISNEFSAPLENPPQRVVSLIPSITETLFDLNLGGRVVGITDYCVRPASGLVNIPRVGGTKNPNIKHIIALRPDLVLVNREENRRQDAEALHAAGIPVWVMYPRTVQESLNLLWTIMDVFNETSMHMRVRVIEKTYDWVYGISRARDGAPCRVFVPIWNNPLMTFNADTYSHDLLQVCGGSNVFAGHETRYPRITLDDVVAAQPDVILLPSEPFAFDEAHVATFAALDIPAAHQSNIHLVDGSLLTWHGTRLAYALDEIPPLMCPQDMP